MSDIRSDPLIFYVNGKKIVEEEPDPESILTSYLRQKLLLTGTKIGCGVGQCGACTVMISSYNSTNKTIKHRSVNSCLTPLCSLHGQAVTTVEGIGSTRTGLHAIQERLVKSYGIQCGFCTPGIVMSMYALLRNHPKPTLEQIENALKGNLCRCTGYRPILEGLSSFTDQSQCPMGENCCKNMDGKNVESPSLYDASTFKPYDPSQELIFPTELQLSDELRGSSTFRKESVVWYKSASLSDVFHLKVKHPDATLVAGASRVGLNWRVRPKVPGAVYIDISTLHDLCDVTVSDGDVIIGAGVTVADLQEKLGVLCRERPQEETSILRELIRITGFFGGQQVKNVGTIGGSIMAAGTKSDILPLLAAGRAKINLASSDAKRQVILNESFFFGPGKCDVKPEELLTSIVIPLARKGQMYFAYKQSPRKDLALSTLNCGAMVDVKEEEITDILLYFGGLSQPIVMANKTAEAILNRKVKDLDLKDIQQTLETDIGNNDVSGNRLASFKVAIAQGFLIKMVNSLTARKRVYEGQGVRGQRSDIQVIERVPEGQVAIDTVGRPLPHYFAEQQATGEALFIDDMAPIQDELYLSPVLSSKPHARLVSVDPSPALAIPGVVGYVDHTDIPGIKKYNLAGNIEHDEQCFAMGEVHFDGQMIGAIVADNPQAAKTGARSVKVEYEALPYITSIQEAIDGNSYIRAMIPEISSGDTERALSECEVVVEGEMETSGQEHFYMETQAVRVIPRKENEEYEVHASVQLQHGLQVAISKTLELPCNKIKVKTRRAGGGFGGKECSTGLVALPCAVAAYRYNRPVRCMLDRYEDMRLTGGRHPFYVKYKVGASKEGKVEAMFLDIYSNGGWNTTLTPFVTTNAMWNADNCYSIPNRKFVGRGCRTNRHSNHAMRGAGQPQGVMATEFAMYELARKLGIPRFQLLEKNLYSEGDKTPYGQEIVNCTIKKCFAEAKTFSNFEQRLQEIDAFNRENKWRKRGIDLMPIKFCPVFGLKHMNQADAYVVVYTDGSVLLTHGGIEMGQGLHTKMLQVASRVLEIPVDRFVLQDTSTGISPNQPPTAGSSGSDLHGMAVLNACTNLNNNLKPIKEANPSGSWDEWITKAFEEGISLTATGHYLVPDVHYPINQMRSPYFCFGAGSTEVELDCLTGEHIVRRVDIVMDVGKSLNPAIDVGQIEGAFMMGYGMYAMEDIRYTASGMLETCSPDSYKIPTVTDIPLQFNVALLKDAPNPKAVYSSKAIGEPPLLLGSSAYFAIKEAARAFRESAGDAGRFDLGIPATPDRVIDAIKGSITKTINN